MAGTRSNHSFAWLLSIIALISIVSLQSIYDSQTQDFRVQQKKKAITFSEPLVPSLPALQFLSLGHKTALADLLWLQTIQYFGSGNPYGKYQALGPILERITQLDPQFEYPYEFGMIVLPFMNASPSALRLGEQAQKELPNNGLLTYYHASNYMLYEKDYAKAALFYDKASKLPDAPGASAELAATALNRVHNNLNDRLIARDYWRTVRENAKTDADAERAAAWEAQMQQIYELEIKLAAYKQTFGQFPASFQDLLKTHFINEVPVSPVQRVLEIDQQNGRILFEKIKE